MKKQLYVALFALIMGLAVTVEAACGNGRCGIRKEQVRKERRGGCSTGTCGK